MPFAIEIIGTNASEASAYVVEQKEFIEQTFVASPSRKTNKGWVMFDGDRAQFATHEEADTVGMACRWNNQQYRVKVVRGHVNSVATGRVIGCQQY